MNKLRDTPWRVLLLKQRLNQNRNGKKAHFNCSRRWDWTGSNRSWKESVNKIAEKFGHEFTYDEALIGHVAIEATGNPLPDESLQKMKASDAVLFGAVGHPKYDNDPSAKVRPEQGLLKMRKELGPLCQPASHKIV
jgi:hypothetical protein